VPEARRRVVYIEDEVESIELVRLILEPAGLEVIGAWNGQEGLEKVQPDLVLLDLMLPDTDGWEVYDQIQADDELMSIPVIVLTVKAMPVDKLLGLHSRNVADYITKPYGIEELLESVNGVLGKAVGAGGNE
jgi:DNA-binding response OmpR family regulator